MMRRESKMKYDEMTVEPFKRNSDGGSDGRNDVGDDGGENWRLHFTVLLSTMRIYFNFFSAI